MKRFLVLVFFILLMLMGCRDSTYLDPTKVLSDLGAPAFGGRRVGSVGNRKAAEYIVGKMEQVGLIPWTIDGYAVPYTHSELSLEEITLKVVYSGGTKRLLRYGSEFCTGGIGQSLNLCLPIVTSACGGEEACAFFTAGDWRFTLPEEKSLPSGSLLLKRTEDLHYSPNRAPADQSALNIQIRADIYDQIFEQGPVFVELQATVIPLEYRAHNIVGRIPGNDSRRAIIIGAHFDGQGDVGDMILPGVYDNVSGTAAMLAVASKLGEESTLKKFAVDLVFCAFNSEENMRQGSQAFYREIVSVYDECIMINIDSVGGCDCGPLAIAAHDENSTRLYEAMRGILDEYGIAFSANAIAAASDHLSFSALNMASMTLTQDQAFAIAHSAKDQFKHVKSTEIQQVADAVVCFVRRYHDELPLSSLKDDQGAINRKVEEIRAQLAFNECYVLRVDDSYAECISGNPRLNADELRQYFPGMTVPETLYGFPFLSVVIYHDAIKQVLPEGLITTLPIVPENIVWLRLHYSDGRQAAALHIERLQNYQPPAVEKYEELEGCYKGYSLQLSQDQGKYDGFVFMAGDYVFRVSKGEHYEYINTYGEIQEMVAADSYTREEAFALIDELDLNPMYQAIIVALGLPY